LIDIQIDDSPLARQIQKLEGAEQTIGAEFQGASRETVEFLTKDLRRGVGSVTGELQGSITGSVKSTMGVEMESLISAHASHGGYEYGARLDKDGSLRWRSGKFRSYRTFGWFTKVLERLAPKTARRFYQKALDRAVKKLAG
jgi:hypothetical protein